MPWGDPHLVNIVPLDHYRSDDVRSFMSNTGRNDLRAARFSVQNSPTSVTNSRTSPGRCTTVCRSIGKWKASSIASRWRDGAVTMCGRSMCPPCVSAFSLSSVKTNAFQLQRTFFERVLGLFMPSNTTLSRNERCTMGLTSFLTLGVILLIVSDLMPKSDTEFCILGTSSACYKQAKFFLFRPLPPLRHDCHLCRHNCVDHRHAHEHVVRAAAVARAQLVKTSNAIAMHVYSGFCASYFYPTGLTSVPRMRTSQ